MNYRVDQSSERQPAFLRMNARKVRLYFGHTERETEDDKGEKHVTYEARFYEIISGSDNVLSQVLPLVVADIVEYDSSPEVNLFYLNGEPMWMNDEKRRKLMRRLEAEKAENKQVTTIWDDETNIPYTLPVEETIVMLNKLEVYASECYDNTHRHIANVSQITDQIELVNYDYSVGYPGKLNVVFDIPAEQ